MNKLKYCLLLTFLIISNSDIFALSADDVLSNAAEKYHKDGSILAQFNLTGQGSSSDGSITISGDKFLLETPELTIWYDGRTQWTYSKEIQEVNITEPTVEELQQINPFAVINSFRRQFNSSMMQSSKGTHRLQLTPLQSVKTTISKIVLTLDTATLYPSEIILTLDNNAAIYIKVRNTKAITSVPASAFIFDEKKHPGVDIIDLR